MVFGSITKQTILRVLIHEPVKPPCYVPKSDRVSGTGDLHPLTEEEFNEQIRNIRGGLCDPLDRFRTLMACLPQSR